MTTKTIEQVQEDNEILAETNRNCLKEIETLKAQLQDKALVIANLNIEIEAKAEYNHDLRVRLDEVVDERDAQYKETQELRRETHDQKLRIEKHEATIARKKSLQDKANARIAEQEQALEDISRTARVRLENYNELSRKYDIVTGERDAQAATILELSDTITTLRQTLKAVL